MICLHLSWNPVMYLLQINLNRYWQRKYLIIGLLLHGVRISHVIMTLMNPEWKMKWNNINTQIKIQKVNFLKNISVSLHGVFIRIHARDNHNYILLKGIIITNERMSCNACNRCSRSHYLIQTWNNYNVRWVNCAEEKCCTVDSVNKYLYHFYH